MDPHYFLIWIRICISVKCWIRIQNSKSTVYRLKMESWRIARLVIAKSIIMKMNWIRFLIKVKCRIRISTKVYGTATLVGSLVPLGCIHILYPDLKIFLFFIRKLQSAYISNSVSDLLWTVDPDSGFNLHKQKRNRIFLSSNGP